MDALFEIGAETLIGEDIDFALQNGFQFLTEFNQIQQASSLVHLHQEIDIARWSCFPSRNRSKYTHMVCSMLRGELKDIMPFGL